jgi:hypothetical protein
MSSALLSSTTPAEYPGPESASPAPVWRSLAHAVTGGRHRRENRCGQDAAFALVSPRPGVFACDGRGSSPRSQLGSAAAVAALPFLLYQLSDPLAAVLDDDIADPADAELAWRRCAILQVRGLAAELARLTLSHDGIPKDFEFTTALALVGKHHVGALSLGDCSLVLSHSGRCSQVLAPPSVEFAGDTRFVAFEPNPERHVRAGLFPSAGLDGAAAFSDGTAVKLIHARDGSPVGGFGKLLDYALNPDGKALLADFLEAPLWQTTVEDDRCIALVRLAPPVSLGYS